MTRIIIRERLGTPAVGSQNANSFLGDRSGGATICLSLRRSAFMQLLLLSPWGPDNQVFNDHGKVIVCSSIYLPFRWSRIRYQEKEPDGRELEELYVFFKFSGKKIRRTKGSKSHTDNITGTGNTTAIYLIIWHHLNFYDIHLISNIFSELW